MNIKRENRALLIVSYLERSKPKGWEKHVYPWLEENGVDLARMVLTNNYERIVSLEGVTASFENTMQTIKDLTGMHHIKAVDVFIFLHGSESKKNGYLYFYEEKRISSSTIETALQALPTKNRQKLRACYSTACYGTKTAHALVRGGFWVASGAVGINANAHIEYPIFLSGWEDGETFAGLVRKGFDNLPTQLSDRMIANIIHKTVCSRKIIAGRGATRITTDPRATHEIRLVTASHRGAGTDADVHIRLYGSEGKSPRFLLDNPGNDHEKGDIDYHYVKANGIGDVEKVVLEQDGSGFGPDWFLAGITVKDLASGKKVQHPCMVWIEEDDPVTLHMM